MNIKVISLKRRPDRRLKFFKNFHKYFTFEFVDAMDGLEYTLTEEDKKMIEGNIYDTMDIHIPSLVCANRMHMKLYEECIRLNEPIIIFEDDAELIKPIDFSLEEIYNRTDLDVFWLMPDMVSILTYIVWPSGAKILLDYIKEVGLSDGLDIKYTGIKYSGRLREDKLHDEYFTQYPGVESDITPLPYYGNTKEEFDGFLRWQKDPKFQNGNSTWVTTDPATTTPITSLRFGLPEKWRCNDRNCHNYFMFGFMDLLLTLKDYFPGKDYKMIEIGSYMGESTMLFASTHIFDTIFSIDPHSGDEEFNDMYGYDWEFIKNEYKLNTRFFNNIVHLEDYSYNVNNKFEDNSIDFIYIDGNHSYEALKKDFELFLPKLKPGGIIAGHDWVPGVWDGTILAIRESIGEPDKIFSDFSWIKKLK